MGVRRFPPLFCLGLFVQVDHRAEQQDLRPGGYVQPCDAFDFRVEVEVRDRLPRGWAMSERRSDISLERADHAWVYVDACCCERVSHVDLDGERHRYHRTCFWHGGNPGPATPGLPSGDNLTPSGFTDAGAARSLSASHL